MGLRSPPLQPHSVKQPRNKLDLNGRVKILKSSDSYENMEASNIRLSRGKSAWSYFWNPPYAVWEKPNTTFLPSKIPSTKVLYMEKKVGSITIDTTRHFQPRNLEIWQNNPKLQPGEYHYQPTRINLVTISHRPAHFSAIRKANE